MNPGVSAKVPKSDIRVPKRKSEVSKCESDCQARNLSIVQKCKMSAGSSGKKNITTKKVTKLLISKLP